MTEGTIEERIVELQSKKNSLIAGAMGGASKGALQVNEKKSRTHIIESTCHVYTITSSSSIPLTTWLDVLAMSLGVAPGMCL